MNKSYRKGCIRIREELNPNTLCAVFEKLNTNTIIFEDIKFVPLKDVIKEGEVKLVVVPPYPGAHVITCKKGKFLDIVDDGHEVFKKLENYILKDLRGEYVEDRHWYDRTHTLYYHVNTTINTASAESKFFKIGITLKSNDTFISVGIRECRRNAEGVLLQDISDKEYFNQRSVLNDFKKVFESLRDNNTQ